eukprot:symbB.v1.2.025975.t1/scaffold2560.1/size76387/7
MGFGKGAGIALYASLLNIFPKQVSAMVLFSPIVLFPSFLAQKMEALRKVGAAKMKVFTVWGNRNRLGSVDMGGISAQIIYWGGRYTRHTLGYLLAINGTRSTPGTYRQLLAQTLKKAKDVHCTPDTLPDADHSFDSKSVNVLTSMLPLCLPR